MNKKERENKIPNKNYIIVLFMFLAVIVVGLVTKNIFKSYREYELTIPIISGEIAEVKLTEFDNYVAAHDMFLLYIGTSSDSNCRSIEKELISLIKKNNLKDKIIYLNISDEKDKTKFMTDFVTKYKLTETKKIINYPFFGLFYNSELVDFVSKNESDLRMDNISQFLDEYDIGD